MALIHVANSPNLDVVVTVNSGTNEPETNVVQLLFDVNNNLEQKCSQELLEENESQCVESNKSILLDQFVSRRGSVMLNIATIDKSTEIHSLSGTTLYIATCNVDLSDFLENWYLATNLRFPLLPFIETGCWIAYVSNYNVLQHFVHANFCLYNHLPVRHFIATFCPSTVSYADSCSRKAVSVTGNHSIKLDLYKTAFGLFKTYVFQDLIDKRYILALTYGEIAKQEPLYIRLHSSCVTSETLRGCDCDCAQQLESALKIIAEKQRGIVFYLLQEGRGVGYVSKARDRMLVQASRDQISTFQAYHAMGLKNDHRQYENIPQICHLLDIDGAQFILLTNNPDKIQALTKSGLCILRTEALQFEPSPYNVAYLISKQDNGHTLRYPNHTIHQRKTAPHPVQPFKPFAVPNAQRFVYCASYYLPMKPIDNEIVLTEIQFHKIFHNHSIEYYSNLPNPCVINHQLLRKNRHMIKIDVNNLKMYGERHENDPLIELLTTPYWFKVI
ncbi:unnamed protein product [Adineta ricciae]|uniref:GTP cyclohydrolase II domain-containing protein n=1 Tax=Adineta ricciae TaxID=249248 RepID=A0A815XX60_ADIRI|nr:unnamed protein product [Adineta ricciae]